MLTRLFLLCIVIVGMVGFAEAQPSRPGPQPPSLSTYRQKYPLPDATSLSNTGVVLNTPQVPQDQLDNIVQSKFKWVRIKLNWDGVEPRPGRYNFSAYDALLNKLAKRRIRAILLLAYGHPIYSNGQPPKTEWALRGWERYVSRCMARYGGKGHIWEVWNEPMLQRFWDNPNPEDYTRLVQRTAKVIRSYNSQEWIAGLAGAFPNVSSDDYIERTYQAGLLNHIDIVSMHPYVAEFQAPEVREESWQWLRRLTNLYAPANKSIAFISSEGGFSAYYPSLEPVRRGRLTARWLLHSQMLGISVSALYCWTDSYDSINPANNFFGLLDANLQETTALQQTRRILTDLEGYKYSKRLATDSPNDYVLLYTKGNQTKLVCWTTDAPHTITMDSSPNVMDAATFDSTFVTQSQNQTIALALSEDVTIFTPRTENPLLILAGQWAKAPATAIVGNIADAKASFESVVASPAWADAPAGTTLTVHDIPDNQPALLRPSFSQTFSDLGALTPGSAAVNALFASLPCVQDHSDGTHQLRFRLNLPDGTQIEQTSLVSPRTPLAVEIRALTDGAFTSWIMNPSGKAFSGTVMADAQGVTQTFNLTFSPGEKEKRVVFPLIIGVLTQSGVQVSLKSSSPDVAYPNEPVVLTRAVKAFALSPIESLNYTIERGGPQASQLSVDLSVVTEAGTPEPGNTLLVDATVPEGWSYYDVLATNMPLLTSAPAEVGAWIYGDESGGVIQARFDDVTGERFQMPAIRVDWTGWRWVRLSCATWQDVWGGNGDRVMQFPVRMSAALVVSPTNYYRNTSQLKFQGITVIAQ